MNTTCIQKAALWTASLLVVALIVVVVLPVQPHGRFSTQQVENEADAYFEFAAGKAATVVFGGERGREGTEFRHTLGDYYKQHGSWVLVTDRGSTGQLCATLLSLTIVDDKGRKDGQFYRYEIYKGR